MKNIIDLSGGWKFKLDDKNEGIQLNWYERTLTDNIKLPGSTDLAAYGERNSFEDRYRLSKEFQYVGAAWYQKEINITEDSADKEIILFLERCHWETRVWLDGVEIGMQDSLCVEHKYDVTRFASPGKHILTIRVDNNIKYNVGKDAHSVTKETQTNWNGIIGKIQLEIFDKLYIEEVQVYPNLKGNSAKLVVTIKNNTESTIQGSLLISAQSCNCDIKHEVASKEAYFIIDENKKVIETDYYFGEEPLLWDEFNPALYNLSVKIEAKADDRIYESIKSVKFGMREFKTEGTQFTINGRKTFLRGTLECCVFPKTGYPETDLSAWITILKTTKNYGLNHIRFHSWCPPEAAFEAADLLGLMLQIETPVWTVLGEDEKLDEFIYNEGDRILKTYGNHPSFCMLAVGNEPSGDKQVEFLSKIVNYWKQKDCRRVYTGCSGWPEVNSNDYHSLKNRNGVTRCQDWGDELNGRLNAYPLTTDFDFTDQIAGCEVPIVSHEIGQWCAFPNLKEMEKYTGILKPRNFKIVKEALIKNGMIHQAEDFLMASGKFQTLLYKTDIEAALRTPGFGGFQLLGLSDFPGQGTALVGVLDAFWQEKGYVTAKEYRKFCCEVVPLLRMKKVVWDNDESFNGEIEVANFGAKPLDGAIVTCSVDYKSGKNIFYKEFNAETLPVGNGIKVGKVKFELKAINIASELTVSITIKDSDYLNSWSIWVYPEKLEVVKEDEEVQEDKEEEIVVTKHIAEAEEQLAMGKKVLLIPELNSFEKEEVPAGFTTIFWNTVWTNGQKPHTLGILCKPENPALKEFITDYHSNWHWFDLIKNSKFMVIDELPKELTPIIQVIDDWNENRKVALAFEAKVGQGRLLLCSIDLNSNMEERPVARQLKYSLLKYMASDAFQPKDSVNFEIVKGIF